MEFQVANPIYDTVFKYLMEDERDAKTLLSALLKRNVTKVEVRRHEYTNGSRDSISMFRIDFGATIREEDGREKLILIELQKTWLETETLRFRQYLGAHYANPENIIKGDKNGCAVPTVAVYLLGHKVGDIEEAIIYVSHKAYDYSGKEVKKGIPDPFVESLTHDSIIVQIPRLHRMANNRLEKVLSIFDQTRKASGNRQMLNIDESLYDGDEEMQHIVRRLQMAASDAKLRQDMNVEDEYFLAIENRDTAIMMRDKRIKEQDNMLEEKTHELEKKGKELEEKGKQLEEKGKELEEKSNQLRAAIELLLRNGMSEESVAVSLGVNVDLVREVAGRK